MVVVRWSNQVTQNSQAEDILYLSHCVPNPPDKGERIRAHHELKRLARDYRVHLVCFGRSAAELQSALVLQPLCVSVYAELLPRYALAAAGWRFLRGQSLTSSFYFSKAMRKHIGALNDGRLAGAIVYSTAMWQYAPQGVPAVVDMVDVDSEKWRQYAASRQPAFAYKMEARRLQQTERQASRQAAATFLSTQSECQLLKTHLPKACPEAMENGVDQVYFAPSTPSASDDPFNPQLVFLGAMNYYPNVEAVCWFVRQVLPQLRAVSPDIRLLIVGRNPNWRVKMLARQAGVQVIGEVSDVRPYLVKALACIAPLRIARGVQNKVLEALAMGKPVLGSPSVCRTFGTVLPAGVFRCDLPEDYISLTMQLLRATPPAAPILDGIRTRFSWDSNLQPLVQAIEQFRSATSVQMAAAVVR